MDVTVSSSQPELQIITTRAVLLNGGTYVFSTERGRGECSEIWLLLLPWKTFPAAVVCIRYLSS
jgi:hypothetical protein